MANVNKIILIGRLTRDPELRQTQGGTALAEFGLAVNEEWKDSNGEKQSEVMFIDCVAWQKRGEVIAQYLKKGDPIYIEGRLKFDQWQSQDGTKRSKHQVTVDNFQFLGSKKDSEGGGRRDDRDEDRRDPAPPRDEPKQRHETQGDGPGSDPAPSTDFSLEEEVPF